MQVFKIDLGRVRSISAYGARGVAAASFLDFGELTINCLRYSRNSLLPKHVGGRPQLLVVVEGEGWVSSEAGDKLSLRAGQAAFWQKGESHESGSSGGMTVVVVQSAALDLPARLAALEHPAALVVVGQAG